MFGKIIGKKNSVIFTWLFAYITILLIPISLSCAVYYITQRTLEDEIIKAHQLILSQVQQKVDNIAERVELMADEIMVNPRMNALITMYNKNDNFAQFEIFKIRQDLSIYSTSKYFLKRFFVYINSMDMVINSEICSDSETFFSSYLTSDITSAQWKTVFSQNTAGRFIEISGLDGQTNSKLLPYVKTLQPLGIQGNKANLVVLVDKSELLNGIEQVESMNDSTAFIVNKEGRIIASSKNDLPVFEIPYQQMSDDKGYLYKKIGHKDMVISYITSGVEEWKYVFITPREDFWKRARYVSNILNLGIFLSILIGGSMIGYHLRKSYSPIDNIIQLFKNKSKIDPETKSNEYVFIEQAITSTLQENQKNLNTIEKQLKIVRSAYLAKLLRGTIENYGQVSTTLASYNAYFNSESFSVMLLNVEDFDELFPDEKVLNGAERQSLAKYILTNVIEELASQRNQGIMVEIDEMLACLINFDCENVVHSRQEMIRIAEEAQGFILKNFNIRIMVSISNVHETFIGISKAYQEALQAMEYKMVMGVREIAEYANIHETLTYEYGYSLEKEQKLINFIKAGDFIKSKAIVDDIFEDVFMKDKLSVKITRCMMSDMISTMIKAIIEISNVLEDSFLEESNPIERLLACSNVSDMKTLIMNFLEQICEYTSSKSNNSSFINEVVQYINENFNKSSLSVSEIGNQFNLTPPYLSSLFKEKIGESILDYISRLRIEKAKYLLLNTYDYLDDIAEKVGYTNKVTFTRLFKKAEGITPGKYREVTKSTN